MASATYVEDIISGDYQIYENGVLRAADESEVCGLEEAAVWDTEHIVRRIMQNVTA